MEETTEKEPEMGAVKVEIENATAIQTDGGQFFFRHSENIVLECECLGKRKFYISHGTEEGSLKFNINDPEYTAKIEIPRCGLGGSSSGVLDMEHVTGMHFRLLFVWFDADGDNGPTKLVIWSTQAVQRIL